jgi:exodeoxyribonuclease VII large subunit
MSVASRTLMRQRRDRFDNLSTRLKTSKLVNAEKQRNEIARQRERVARLAERARRAMATLAQHQAARVHHAGQLLAAFSYRGVLARGFALVRDESGSALRAAAAVQPGAALSLEFADGRVHAVADGIAAPHARPAASKPAKKTVDQGSLF